MEERALAILQKCGAVISDTHVVYAAGRHGSQYVNKDFLCAYTELFTEIVYMLTGACSPSDPQMVVGATMGGAILANRVADCFVHHDFRRIMSAYAEETVEDGEKVRVFRREFDKLIVGKRVLVVEDVVTSGDTVRKVVAAVRKIGGDVVNLGVIWNRGGVDFGDLGIKRVKFLINMTLESYAEEKCPLCERGVPVNVSVGKGREFLERMKDRKAS